MNTDRNLRFGLRALALGLINADQLADAGREWLSHPEMSLADILESRGWISRSDLAAIEETVLKGQDLIDTDAATISAFGERSRTLLTILAAGARLFQLS